MPNGTAVSRGAVATLAGQWGKLLVQVAGIAILSRLLEPTSIGLYAMILAIAGVAAVLSDCGLSLAAVQAADLTRDERSKLFWLNTWVGALAAVGVYLSSGLVATLYGQPSLIYAMQAMAAIFALNSMSAQYRAHLNRQLRFTLLAGAEIVSQLIGLVTATILAILNFGIWALVSQQIAAALLYLIIVVLASGWLPGSPSVSGLRRFASFGVVTMLTQALNYGSTNFPYVVIGSLWGPTVLGIYSRAFQIFAMPLQQLATPLTRVALPILSRATTVQQREYLERAQLLLAYPLFITLGLVAGSAEALVVIFLGDQWHDAAAYLRLLAVGGIFQILGYVYYWAFLAKAKMRILLLCESVGRATLIGLVTAASPLGAQWVALAYSAGLLAIWLITSLWGSKHAELSAWKLTKIAIPPLMLGAVVGLTCWVVVTATENTEVPLPLRGAAGIAAALGIVVCAKFVGRIATDYHVVVGTLKTAAGRRG